jgi:hypothetical protein
MQNSIVDSPYISSDITTPLRMCIKVCGFHLGTFVTFLVSVMLSFLFTHYTRIYPTILTLRSSYPSHILILITSPLSVSSAMNISCGFIREESKESIKVARDRARLVTMKHG